MELRGHQCDGEKVEVLSTEGSGEEGGVNGENDNLSNRKDRSYGGGDNGQEKEDVKKITVNSPSSSSPIIVVHSKDTASTNHAPSIVEIGGGGGEISLQESFQKFLLQKRNERKLQKQCQLQSQSGQSGRDQSFKDRLRAKFIQQAKTYMGVPYAKKYQPEDGPEYPLYLDCCGLVRQVLKDLQHEFGFVIGKWNQAYQYDTLPIRYDRADQMKPGDLVFYSGEYSSKR
jgi:hypothetical protein